MLEDFWFCCIDIRFPGHNKGWLERAALFNMENCLAWGCVRRNSKNGEIYVKMGLFRAFLT